MTGTMVSLRELIGTWSEATVAPVEGEGEGLLDRIGVDDFSIVEHTGFTTFRVTLVFEDELGFAMPAIEGMGLYLGSHGSASRVEVEVDLGTVFAVRIVDVSLILRVPPAVLRPVRREGTAWVPVARADGSPAPYDMAIGRVTIGYGSGGFTIAYPAGAPAIGLSPAMISDSGVVIESEAIAIYLDPNGQPPAGQSAGFLGVHIARAAVSPPESLGAAVPRDLAFIDCSIGTGGFTGQITADWTPAFGGTVGGVTFGLKHVGISFVRNSLTAFDVVGILELPFFDQPVGVEVAIGLDGSLLVGVSAVQPPGVTAQSGLIEFEKPGLLKLSVDALAFSYKQGLFMAKVSGSLTPLALGDNAPSFTVRELSIDSQGHVRLEGGWLNLPKQYSLDFFGFKLEITKIGFGSTGTRKKWVGFSGGLKLIDALPAGASVEGLRLTWDEELLRTDPTKAFTFSLNGVGVEFEVPGAVKFKGAISFAEPVDTEVFDASGQSLGMERVQRFDGAITLDITAVGLRIEAQLVIGSATGVRGNYAFFAIYLSVQLPAGIPLGATGLGLFGMAGLFALSMEPNRRRDEKWYGVGPTDGWYKRNGIIGVANLKTKWDPNPGAIALGAGVTLGTVSDNGYTFAGSVLFVLVIPGPIIMIEGKANLLKERATLSDDPLFRTLAVLDGRAGTVTVGLDVHYRNGKDGDLIDISGGVEAYFDFHDGDAWHIYVGEREPRERRIRADIFKLFKAEAYFMVDSRRLQTGAWIGFDNKWSFGPLKVTLEAWLEGNALLSFKPLQFHGDVWLHGNIGASVFGFGFSIVADAKCDADVFKPFHLLFDVHVKLDLPFPLPDFEANASFEYGPVPDPPPLPLPLKEIAIEHFKVSTKWPLPRNRATPLLPAGTPFTEALLLPNYDLDGDGFLDPAGGLTVPSDLATKIPVVPIDARPRLTFGRAVHDIAMIGSAAPVSPNAQPEPGWEWLGDPAKNRGAARAQFRLMRVALEKHVGGAAQWSEVACRPKKTGVDELYGSWAPIPQLPSGDVAPGSEPPIANVKLWLWSRSPFDFTRQTSRAWDEWFTDRFPSYPCVPPPPDRTICCDFDAMPVGTRLTSPWTSPDHPEITLVWTKGAVGTVTALATPIDGHKRVLCFPGSITRPGRGGDEGRPIPVVVTVTLPAGGKNVRILVRDPHGDPSSGDPNGPSPGAALACVNFAARKPDSGANPRVEGSVSFTALTSARVPARDTRLVASPQGTALDCAFGLDIMLPAEAELVVLTLVHSGTAAKITAFARDGSRAGGATMRAPGGTPDRIAIPGRGIVRVFVDAPTDETRLLELCYASATRVTVSGTDSKGGVVVAKGSNGEEGTEGGVPAGGQVFTIANPELSTVDVSGTTGVCIADACITLAPDPVDIVRHEEMTRHMAAELARWSQTGELLDPDTTYRLRVDTEIVVKDWAWESSPLSTPYNGTRAQTEYAYFRTAGPPGLTELAVPLGTSDPTTFDSGLDDLTLYVAQTVPPTVPGPGEKPPLPRPVYRAYDVGVRFNEDYVDLMYRASQRDLGLYLYDNNDRPVRDAAGRLIVLENRWGTAETRTLSEAERYFVGTVNQSSCARLDEATFPPDRTLTAGDGSVLDADTVYEARLVPLLLHDDFSTGRTQWEAPIDQGTFAAPSVWTAKYHPTLSGTAATVSQDVVTLTGAADLTAVDTAFDVVVLPADTARASRRYRITAVNNATSKATLDGKPILTGGTSSWEIPSLGAIVQTSAIGGGATAGNDPVKLGTMLLRSDAATWTDYRFSVWVRNAAAPGAAAAGAVGVVFRAKDAANYYRFSMDQTRRYRRLVRVVNGAHTILAEDDVSYASNSDHLVIIEAVGSWLRVYVDGSLVFDAHDAAHDRGRVGLYTWATNAARFSDVRVDDFRSGAPIVYRFKFTTSAFVNFFHHAHSYQDESWRAGVDVSAHAARAKAMAAAPTEQERRDYDALATAVLGLAASRTPSDVEVTWLDNNGAHGLLVRSPEPIDWTRTTLQLSRAGGVLAPPRVPEAVKLTAAAFGSLYPNEESLTLLVREAIDLSRYQIDRRVLPAALAESGDDAGSFADVFDRNEQGLLFHEDFGPNALDRYTIVDEEAPGLTAATSAWSVASGQVVQTANYMGGGSTESGVEKPGTFAVVAGASWANLRISSTLRSEDYDDIGVVVRFVDADNYYRFSMSRFGIYRRLTKRIGGAWTVLWEDTQRGHLVGQTYRVTIEAYGDRLVGFLDDALLFSVRDSALPRGTAGFYCWRNTNAHFEAFDVESLDAPTVLWQPAFTSLADVATVDDGATGRPSAWSAAAGVLRQTAAVRGGASRRSVLSPGTYAVGGDDRWEDVVVSARLRSDGTGAIGVMFRYQDARNYYRFAMDRALKFRRLVRVVDGVAKTIWHDAVQYAVGSTYQLSIVAVGSRLSGSLNGEPLFSLFDGAVLRGRVALYCENNGGARFEQVVVTDRSRRVGDWVAHDEGIADAPSAWHLVDHSLMQGSAIGGGVRPAAPGTLLVVGDPAWTDYRLRVRLRSADTGAVGVVFRYVDANNYYRLSLDAEHKEQRLIRRAGGVTKSLWFKGDGFPVNETMEIVVDAAGTRLVGYLGAVKLFDVADVTHAGGRVGLYTWSNPSARFEAVDVRRVPLEASALYRDRFLAGSRSGWTTVNDGSLGRPSKWTVVDGTLRQTKAIHSAPIDRNTLDKPGTYAVTGDVKWRDLILTARLRSPGGSAIGIMFGYEDASNYYRFSMDRVQGYRRLVRKQAGVFQLLWEDAVRYDQTRAYELTVLAEGSSLRGFIDGVPLFAVTASPIKGRIALYSWNNADARFSHVIVFPARLAYRTWLLDETFLSRPVSPWTAVDDGTQSGKSQWVLTNSLRQTSLISDGTNDATPAKAGTYIVGGSAEWQDYRLSVRLSSGSPDGVGVMFRYRDRDNYYRFSMDRTLSYRRLVSNVGGAITVLWQDAVPYEIDRDYIVTVDCVGSILRGYLDGVALFEVVDPSHERGQVGAYTWKNGQAVFSEFRVGAPSWAEYYMFGSEGMVAAGSRLRVHAGNPANAAPEEVGVQPRFAASFSEWGQLTLTPGMDVRVRAPGTDAGHVRGFLPSAGYLPAVTRILRRADETGRADGTAFALFPDVAGTTFPEGQYRLRLEYRRNNRQVDASSTILRQAGQDTPEIVELDIPG